MAAWQIPLAITGWHEVKDDLALPDGVMVAAVPAELTGKRLRHLYVGGVRAARTRVSAGYLNLTLVANWTSEVGRGRRDHTPSQPAAPRPPPPPPLDSFYRSNSSEPQSWANAGDAEFVYSGVASNWAETRCTVAKVSPGSKSSTTEISRASGIC